MMMIMTTLINISFINIITYMNMLEVTMIVVVVVVMMMRIIMTIACKSEIFANRSVDVYFLVFQTMDAVKASVQRVTK